MSYETYKILHLMGLGMLFLSLGGVFVHYHNTTARKPRFLMITHGLAMVIVFVAGFGLQARLGIGWPWPTWIYGKVALWLLAGFVPFLIRTRFGARVAVWVFLPLMMLLGAFLAVYKP